MKLQHRFLLWLIPILMGVYLTSQVVQGYLHHRSLIQLEDETFAALQEAAQQNATSLEAANLNSILDWMIEGDMDRVENIMRAQRSVPGVIEFSLFDPKGRNRYSSHEEFLKNEIPAAVAEEIAQKKEAVIEQHDGEIAIYRPMMGEQRCNDCHFYEDGEIAGVTLIRLSTEAIDHAETSWSNSLTEMRGQEFVTSSSTALVLLVVLGLVSLLIVHRLVARPFAAIAERLREQAHSMRDNAAKSADIASSIAEGASQSAAALEESHASAEEISGTTKGNTETAIRAQEVGSDARRAADQGTTDMAEMKAAMSEIEAGSSEIANIIKTIDEIAFQTNILALNAAVEAARAGEAGMGFAVVAEEVRNLAQRAAMAARETTEKIESSLERTRHGAKINAKVAHSLEEIAAKAREFDELVEHVATASREQSKGIEQLSVGLSQMDQVTQTNAAHANEGADSAANLNRQSEQLTAAVATLEALITGKTATEPTSRPPASGRRPSASSGRQTLSSNGNFDDAFSEFEESFTSR